MRNWSWNLNRANNNSSAMNFTVYFFVRDEYLPRSILRLDFALFFFCICRPLYCKIARNFTVGWLFHALWRSEKEAKSQYQNHTLVKNFKLFSRTIVLISQIYIISRDFLSILLIPHSRNKLKNNLKFHLKFSQIS